MRCSKLLRDAVWRSVLQRVVAYCIMLQMGCNCWSVLALYAGKLQCVMQCELQCVLQYWKDCCRWAATVGLLALYTCVLKCVAVCIAVCVAVCVAGVLQYVLK